MTYSLSEFISFERALESISIKSGKAATRIELLELAATRQLRLSVGMRTVFLLRWEDRLHLDPFTNTAPRALCAVNVHGYFDLELEGQAMPFIRREIARLKQEDFDHNHIASAYLKIRDNSGRAFIALQDLRGAGNISNDLNLFDAFARINEGHMQLLLRERSLREYEELFEKEVEWFPNTHAGGHQQSAMTPGSRKRASDLQEDIETVLRALTREKGRAPKVYEVMLSLQQRAGRADSQVVRSGENSIWYRRSSSGKEHELDLAALKARLGRRRRSIGKTP